MIKENLQIRHDLLREACFRKKTPLESALKISRDKSIQCGGIKVAELA